MRVLLLIALCLAVATANYANNRNSHNQFNRLLRQLQRQQQQQQQQQGIFSTQGLQQFDDENDSDEQDELDDEQDNLYQQQQQCRRQQRYGQLNLDDDEDQDQQDQYDQDQDDEYQQQNQYNQYGQQRQQNQQQRRQQQQRRRQQQQQHQCSPKYQHLQALEQANTQLAAKLYKQAKQENDDKNTVVSPAAVQLAAAAIKRGARGNTKRQLQRILGAGLNNQQTRQAHAALQNSLQGQDPLQQQTGQNQQAKIKTTTTIILNQQTHAQQRFIQATKACLNTQVKRCNFQRQPQQCRQQINRYVAQKTNGKLQHTVPQDAVTTNTKAIVVNTAQIKAQWGRQFRNQQQTKQGKFYPLGSQQPKHVQVIKSQGQFNYYEDEQVQVVGVPTQQQELTVYVIVPKDKDGLNQVEKQQIQNGQQLKQLLEQADQQQEQVQVELPKIQIKHKIDAKQTLQKQGAQDAFDADEADLSGINGQQNQQQQQQQQQRRNRRQQQQQDDEDQDQDEQQQQQQNQQNQQQLHINKLIHQATIKINEQGISAANPQNRGQQQQNQYQDQDQDQDEQDQQQQQQNDEDDEDDEQQDHYLQQQELLEEIFGQNQNQNQRRRRQQQQQQQRRNRRHHNQQQQYQGQQQGQKKVKANRAFAFAIKHNNSNQIVMIGRVVDASQKPKNQQQQGRQQQQGQQSLNGVDQQ